MSLYINFILDRSGSMSAIHNAVVEGFNKFIKDQQAATGEEPRMTLTLFDTEAIEQIFTGVPLHLVDLLTTAMYQPRGGTPLLDAIGQTIRKIEPLVDKKDAVLTVIFTDGQENSSREWTKDGVKKEIKRKSKAGWEFVYLGANVDAFAEAGAMGVAAGSTFSYLSTAVGTQTAYATTSGSTNAWRSANDATFNQPPTVATNPAAGPKAKSKSPTPTP